MTSTCDENMLNFQIEEHKKISNKYNSQVIEIKSLKALVCYPKKFCFLKGGAKSLRN